MSPWKSRWSWVTLVKAAAAKRQPSTRPSASAVRGDLHRDGVDAARAHLAQRALEVEALGRRVHRAPALVREADLDRADEPDAPARRPQDRLDQVRGARLAVRAGDADERRARPRAGRRSARRAARGRAACRATTIATAGAGSDAAERVDEERGGAEGERLRQVVVAVGERAAQRDEEVARHDFARVVAQAAQRPGRRRRGAGAARARRAGRRAAPRAASAGPGTRAPARRTGRGRREREASRIVPGAGSCSIAVPSAVDLDRSPVPAVARRTSAVLRPEKSGTQELPAELLDAEAAARGGLPSAALLAERERSVGRRGGGAGVGLAARGGQRGGAWTPARRAAGITGSVRMSWRASCAAATRANTGAATAPPTRTPCGSSIIDRDDQLRILDRGDAHEPGQDSSAASSVRSRGRASAPCPSCRRRARRASAARRPVPPSPTTLSIIRTTSPRDLGRDGHARAGRDAAPTSDTRRPARGGPRPAAARCQTPSLASAANAAASWIGVTLTPWPNEIVAWSTGRQLRARAAAGRPTRRGSRCPSRAPKPRRRSTS